MDSDEARRFAEAIEFANTCHSQSLAFALLQLLTHHAQPDPASAAKLADAYDRMLDSGHRGFRLRYEAARALSLAQEKSAAADAFLRLYRDSLDSGVVPPIDSSMYQAIADGAAEEQWDGMITASLQKLLDQKLHRGAMRLIQQAYLVGDKDLATYGIIAAGLWPQIAYCMILYLTGLNNVSSDQI